MTASGPFTLEARDQRKSARTRARLMDAAVEVFARDGLEAASVNEIARLAEVANGTFYVHFKDKDAVVAEVAYRIGSGFARQINETMIHIDDAAERFSWATRQFIEMAASEPRWGWVLIRSAWYAPDLHRRMESSMRLDLERGVRQGVFDCAIDGFVIATILAMIMSALAARLRGEAGADAGSRVSEMVLRMLGAPPSRAREVAWRRIEFQALNLAVLPRPPRAAGTPRGMLK